MVRRLLLLLALAHCNASSFDPQTLVGSVRVIAARADKPYARPGDVVNLEALVVDERPTKPQPMKTYWIPLLCTNPRDDLYYACFSSFVPNAGPMVSGPPQNLPPFLRPGADITAFLSEGTTYKVTLPGDIITKHAATPGADEPYGIAFVFFIACAGRVRVADIDFMSKNPQVMPIRCTDDDGVELGPDDWVFAFTRIYAYDHQTNENPVIDSVVVDGQPISLREGITVPPCTSKDCKKPKIDAVVPVTSWEERPVSASDPTTPRHELVYAMYYFSRDIGTLDVQGRVLWDATKGKVDDTAVVLSPSEFVAEGHIWIVAQDNRNGTSWVEVPVHVR
jgi:hypothetical protein